MRLDLPFEPVEARSFFALSHDVLIIGASARAAAFSAMRCGLRPCCADHFADRDLASACPVERVDFGQGPGAFAAVAESFPPSPWFYTGGPENHPELVERISRRHRLWGVGADALRRVRDPVALAEDLAEAGIPAPEVRVDSRGIPRDGSWLVKPLASGGGIGVEPLVGHETGESPARYYQRRIEGPSYSALFIGSAGRARLVDVARQWVGGVPGRPFAYRGGIGPCRVGQALAARLRELGSRLVSTVGLVGWFGVDYVLAGGIPWPVEVNPRYTASVEIHELAAGRPMLPEHRAACEGRIGPAGEVRDDGTPRSHVVAKWIVYAPRRMVVPEMAWDGVRAGDPGAFRAAIPAVADIPAPGICIEAGEPLMTLLARDSHVGSCRARLRRLRRYWAARLGITAT
jgi:predicted ATP-grasp superfamily ATP-dependent carboligase